MQSNASKKQKILKTIKRVQEVLQSGENAENEARKAGYDFCLLVSTLQEIKELWWLEDFEKQYYLGLIAKGKKVLVPVSAVGGLEH